MVKEYLRTQYKGLRELYKYYAAIDPTGMIFSIGSNVFTDIISNFGDLVDGTTMKLSDIDLEFVSTKAGAKKGTHRNPERALIRYQMIEIFTRMALTKYFKTGEEKTQLGAIKKLFEKYLHQFLADFD